MNPVLLTVLSFMAVATMVAAIASMAADVFLRDRTRVSQRIDEEFRERQRERAKRALLFKDLSQIAAEAEGQKPSLRQRLTTLIEQSGLEVTVDRLLMISGLAALGLGAIVGLLRREPVSAGIAATLGAAVPLLYVQMKRKARIDAMQGQLPDAFDLMARVVRAGQTISQSQQAVADEFGAPISYEFALCAEQQNLGLAPDLALRDLARRTGLLEIKIFVTALLVQQQTGGNLAELLDKLATTVRSRIRTRGKIKALTAEGRMQGMILLVLPPALFLIMLMMRWDFAGVLLEYPAILISVGISELIGALWIRKIVNFDF
jgi:tight adherence protein B